MPSRTLSERFLVVTLAGKSLANRLLVTALTVGSIGLSVALLVGVENVRVGMRESFSNTIRGTDLIVGARGGTIQLLLYSVFGMGAPTNNVKYETYQAFARHPAVAWTIPYSLGDSHHGFRVIGTDSSFYQHYRFRRDRAITFRAGQPARGVFDVVIGADVAERRNYQLGDAIVVTHGMGATGIMDHDATPFRIVGIMERTFTPIDRAVYVTLHGIAAIHVGWEAGAPPAPGSQVAASRFHPDSLPIEQITSFFLAAKSRAATLRLQREVNTFEAEPLMAVIPGVALSEMWRTIGYAEEALRIVSAFVLVVGLLGMLVSLYTSLNARRREMAILRAVGVGAGRIVSLLVLESGFLAALGCLVGVLGIFVMLALLQAPIESRFGLFLPIRPLGPVEYVYLGGVVGAALLIGLVPAIKAYRNTLADGLSVRL
jgi:putative ABC transport system permease protein